MAFDPEKQRGVRRRTIPAPMSMQFSASCGYEEVLKIGKETFFPDFDDSPLTYFCLSDSSGTLYCIKNKATWTLSEFLNELGIAPSKLRLYAVYRPEVSFKIIQWMVTFIHYLHRKMKMIMLKLWKVKQLY